MDGGDLALERANADLAAFNSSVSHDLRAPLRGILGYAKILLEDQTLDEDGKAAIAVITKNAMRMGDLIDGLAMMASVHTADFQPRPVSLSEIFLTAAGRVAAADPERRVEVVVHSDVEVRIDPALGTKLAAILFHNAWKFTAKTTAARIEAGVETAGGKRTFFVRDNGAGFDMTHAKNLFAPFERLHPASDFPGIGAGLATARRIVHRHEGTIWAEGSAGCGATLRFTLGENGATS